MALTLSLQVASDFVALSAPAHRAAFWRKASASPARPACITPLAEPHWSAAFDACWEQLAKRGDLRGAAVSARFGASTARVGVMNVVGSTKALEPAHVLAWVEQTWAIDAAAWVVRSSPLPGTSSHLVSCIRREALEQITRACEARKARLVSVQPALIDAWGVGEEVVICLEPTRSGIRYPVVQLLGVQGGRVAGAWRGWMPAAIAADESEILGAARRFVAAHSLNADAPLRVVHWPESAEAT